MFVFIQQCNLLVLKDKNEFFLYLQTGQLHQELVYLQKEDLFIHRLDWLLAGSSESN